MIDPTEMLAHDIRGAFRSLGRSPGFTIAALVTLALGVGATTTLVSVVNAVLLRPLPFPDGDQIVSVYQIVPRPRVGTPLRGGLTRDQFQIWRDNATAVSDVAFWGPRSYTLTGEGEAARLNGAAATASLFPLLGVPPLVGRTFLPEDERPGAVPVLVLSHDTWTRQFGSDGAILGRPLTLDGERYRVVGVMPPGFTFPTVSRAYRDASGILSDAPQFWISLSLSPPAPDPTRDVALAPTLARVVAGVSLEQAEAESTTLVPTAFNDRDHEIDLVPLGEEVVAAVRPALVTLLAAVVFLLLIAGANLTNLLLARAAARRHELGVRLALGGGRGQVVRATLVETMLLALGGCALGTLIAVWGTNAIGAFPPGTIPRADEVEVDGTALIFAVALSVTIGLVVGLIVATRTLRGDPIRALQPGSSRSAGGGSGSAGGRPSRLLAVSQVAAAMVLMVGATLLATSFVGLARVDPGLDPDGVVAFQLVLPEHRFPDVVQQAQEYSTLLDALTAVPGVESVSIANAHPLEPALVGGGLTVDGERTEPPFVAYRIVSPDYFRNLRVPLREGRELTDRDLNGQPDVAVVNEAFARQFLGDRAPLDTEVTLLGSGPVRIVGVVGDVRGGPDTEVRSEIYFSYRQLPNKRPRFSPLTRLSASLRVSGNPDALGATVRAAVRAAVRAVDPELAVFNLATLDEVRSDGLARARFVAGIGLALALVALVLAAVGIYGVMAYGVGRQTRELAIRIALGATAATIMGAVTREGLRLAAVGIVIGGAGAFIVNRYLSSLLVGVSPQDPWTFAAVALAFAAIACGAGYLPARAAARVEPALALRQE